jgi:excinuclease ABC subunit C
MMREVLERRFKRLMTEAPRESAPSPESGGSDNGTLSGEGSVPPSPTGQLAAADLPLSGGGNSAELDEQEDSPWPDLVLIDGGLGQLNAAREILQKLGAEVPLVGIAKGPDRDAGRETFFLPDRDSFKLPPRDPVLYFVERLRDEAHRFAVGSHRTRRTKDLREAGLQEISGIGPTRKRALLHHFGTLKAIERAAVSDLMQVEGISAETARRIYEFFHEGAAGT